MPLAEAERPREVAVAQTSPNDIPVAVYVSAASGKTVRVLPGVTTVTFAEAMIAASFGSSEVTVTCFVSLAGNVNAMVPVAAHGANARRHGCSWLRPGAPAFRRPPATRQHVPYSKAA